MKFVTIYWTCTRDAKRKIIKQFGINGHTTVNGETEACIKDEDLPLFNEVQARGYLKIRNKAHITSPNNAKKRD